MELSAMVGVHEMAEDRLAFAGESAPAVLYAIAHAAPAALRECWPDLPGWIESVLLRAMAKRWEERYQNAEELAADLWTGAVPRLKDTQTSTSVARILVVEDEYDLRRGIKINLAREGLQVLTAATGREGLRAVAAERPDLVLLDIMLPGMNSLDVCRDLRRNGSRAPILMLSARRRRSTGWWAGNRRGRLRHQALHHARVARTRARPPAGEHSECRLAGSSAARRRRSKWRVSGELSF